MQHPWWTHTLETADQWFWPLVDKSAGPDACWPWKGRFETQGGKRYGRIRVFGRRSKPRCHAIAFALTQGYWPKGIACHTCETSVFNPDQSLCCNPAHVYDGTHQSNKSDQVITGRASGGGAARRKLTEAQVKYILASSEPSLRLSKIYGVARNTIRQIRKRKTWKSITEGITAEGVRQ